MGTVTPVIILTSSTLEITVGGCDGRTVGDEGGEVGDEGRTVGDAKGEVGTPVVDDV